MAIMNEAMPSWWSYRINPDCHKKGTPMQHESFLIEKFLKCKQIAMVGVSRDPRSFSRQVWGAFRSRGYDIRPVHPAGSEIDGVASVQHISELLPRPDCALIMVRQDAQRPLLEECLAAGIDLVWIYGIRGRRDVDEGLLKWCDSVNLKVIAGQCPFMFLPETPFYHRIHRGINRMFGWHPR
jgi:predicted CoA-binding protein